jgi:hypothetical protein
MLSFLHRVLTTLAKVTSLPNSGLSIYGDDAVTFKDSH